MIRKNLAVMFAGRLVNVATVFGLAAVVSRAFGDYYFGLYSFFTTVVMIAVFIACFGLDVLMVREGASRRSEVESLLGHVLTLKTITGTLVTLAVLVLFSVHTVFPAEFRGMFYLLLPVILLNTVSQSFWWVGDAFQKNEYHSLLWAGSNLSKFVFVSLFLLAYGTFLSVVVGFLAGEIVSLYVAFSVVRKRLVPVRFRYSGTVARDLLQKAWPIGLGAVLSILFFRVDVILLEYLTTEAVVGWFSASAKILEACAVIPSTVTIVLFPVFSSNSHLPWSRFAVPAMKSLVTMGGIGTATALVFFVTAPQLIPFVYGPDFGESVSVLRVLAWAIIFIFMNMICSYLLVSYRYAGTNTLFHAGAVVFKIGLSLWLIPAYRHLGAAYSTLIAEGVLFLLYSGFFAAMRYVPERPFAVPAIKPVELGENEQIQV